jgi:hypothetical protein
METETITTKSVEEYLDEKTEKSLFWYIFFNLPIFGPLSFIIASITMRLYRYAKEVLT